MSDAGSSGLVAVSMRAKSPDGPWMDWVSGERSGLWRSAHVLVRLGRVGPTPWEVRGANGDTSQIAPTRVPRGQR